MMSWKSTEKKKTSPMRRVMSMTKKPMKKHPIRQDQSNNTD